MKMTVPLLIKAPVNAAPVRMLSTARAAVPSLLATPDFSLTPRGTMTLRDHIHDMGRRGRQAARRLGLLTAEQKKSILLAMAAGLRAETSALLEANTRDLATARERGLSGAMLDRLTLNEKRIEEMARGVEEVAALPDPVGEILSEWTRPNGISITKVRVPIGVIGIIYESRPNVTADAAVLCLKSGNATLLRGGSEAFYSNMAIAAVLQNAGLGAGLPEDSIQLIPFTDRESVKHMAEMDQHLDLIIPRGGKGLIETVVSLARMPVIKHYDGICHVYVDEAADPDMAVRIIVNAKSQKPGVCNAAETLLVHESMAAAFYAKAVPALHAAGVALRGDAALCALFPDTRAATEEDWSTEYLDLILSCRSVRDMDEAMDHIARYGSRHSDCIVTENAQTAARFLAEVDSAAVFWNASTRFNDGGEFGFGCEIGISTDKLHARGPMGLPELTIYKYLVRGSGQVRG
jgi:glutamate-5-semialdehyde dehydrogenase